MGHRLTLLTLTPAVPLFYALAAHIEVEEHELFSAAMLGFDEEEWEALERAHRAVGVPVAALE